MAAELTESPGFLKINSQKIFLLGSILTSFGILLVTVGGSWDITNHLLSKPETFFSPPHALMYTGVAISLIGVIFSFIGWRNLENLKDFYSLAFKIKLIGIGLLTGAGPFDFIWHSNFGLDGLLSPPHFTLITGMFFCSVGGMIGISRYLKRKNFDSVLSYLTILAILPVWLSGSGIISSLSLPFSSTDFFEFNPDPLFAFVVASLAYPCIISFSLSMAFRLSKFRFGMMTILGGLFLLIYSTTAIIPNLALFDSILFYSLNLIPFVLADVILRLNRSKLSLIFTGALLGSIFYMVYYPYVMYTFNEVLLGKLVSPSLIYFVYFEIIESVMIFTIIPAIVVGIIAFLMSGKIAKKILAEN
jgi:hypothetical protein